MTEKNNNQYNPQSFTVYTRSNNGNFTVTSTKDFSGQSKVTRNEYQVSNRVVERKIYATKKDK